MRDLAGKTAVITGAASGIGLALCRRLGADGMRVMMADVEAPALAVAAQRLAAEGIEVATSVTDVSDAASVDALATAALDRFGSVHVLCNNAGVAGGGVSWQVPLATWDWLLRVNFFGVVHGMRSFLPHLVAQGEGHVVNTASVAGLVAAPWMGPYNATKHAVVAVSESAYHELAALGSPVGISVLCPGFVRTRIAEADRNWLDRYGPQPETSADPAAELIRQAAKAAVEAGIDAAVVATAVRDAITGGKFWILTHPELNEAVLGRYRGAVAGDNPEPIGLA